jgi:hypothetical protein
MPPLEEQLFGTWDWVLSEETSSGAIQTPESIGFTVRLVITTTTVEVLHDGEVRESSRYKFVHGQDLDETFVPPRLVYDQPILGVTEHGVGFDGTRLVLFSTCCNGQMHFWKPAPKG